MFMFLPENMFILLMNLFFKALLRSMTCSVYRTCIQSLVLSCDRVFSPLVSGSLEIGARTEKCDVIP